MYAETELMFPYFHNFTQEVQQYDDFCCSQKPNASLGPQSTLVQTTTVSDYNFWSEGDLFKAPEPIIEEPVLGLDPMTAAISMISCGENVISPQSLTVSDIESSIESGQILSEVFYECRKDLLAKDGNETPLSEVMNIEIPNVKTDEIRAVDQNELAESVSLDCLRSMENVHEHEAPFMRPKFLDFSAMDFGNVYGMRRAFSEGDIKSLGNDNICFNQSPKAQPKIMSNCTYDVRMEQLSRYRSKKAKRNFGRKIKYACRKALADNQPRIRGRFAKTEEIETCKKKL